MSREKDKTAHDEHAYQVTRRFREWPWHGSITRLAESWVRHQFGPFAPPVCTHVMVNNLYRVGLN